MAFDRSDVIQGVFVPFMQVFLFGASLLATSVKRMFHISTAGSTSPFTSIMSQLVSAKSLMKVPLSYLYSKPNGEKFKKRSFSHIEQAKSQSTM